MIYERIEKGKREPIIWETVIELVTMDGIRLHNLHTPSNTVYLPQIWLGLSMENSANVVVTDIDIPCSIAVDDK